MKKEGQRNKFLRWRHPGGKLRELGADEVNTIKKSLLRLVF